MPKAGVNIRRRWSGVKTWPRCIANARATCAEACCNGISTSRPNLLGMGFANHRRRIGNRAARYRRTPPTSKTTPEPYASSTSEGGGNTVDQCDETTRMSMACSRTHTTATVARMTTSPHQLPSACQSRFRHARKVSTMLTGGTIMPIDFNASVVHIFQRVSTAGHIAERPSTASMVATAANCTRESPDRRPACAQISESGNADIGSAPTMVGPRHGQIYSVEELQ